MTKPCCPACKTWNEFGDLFITPWCLAAPDEQEFRRDLIKDQWRYMLRGYSTSQLSDAFDDELEKCGDCRSLMVACLRNNGFGIPPQWRDRLEGFIDEDDGPGPGYFQLHADHDESGLDDEIEGAKR